MCVLYVSFGSKVRSITYHNPINQSKVYQLCLAYRQKHALFLVYLSSQINLNTASSINYISILAMVIYCNMYIIVKSSQLKCFFFSYGRFGTMEKACAYRGPAEQ